MDRPHTVLVMRPALRPLLFDAAAEARLAGLAETDPELVVTDFGDPLIAAALERAEVLITGWDCPALDEAALARMPALRAVLHSGGSVKRHMTEAAWGRGLLVSSAVADNAVPVAEYTLAMVISAGKTVYYVDCSAASDGSGSSSSPWNALTDPDGHGFAAGDTLSFKAGTTCRGTLTPRGSGASGSPITIKAYGSGAAPVIEGGGASEATVHLVDQSYWTISGLKVQNSSSTRAQHEGILVEIAGSANQAGISITGDEVANVAGWGDKTGTNASWFSHSAGIAVRVATGSGVFNGVSVTYNNVHDTGGVGRRPAADQRRGRHPRHRSAHRVAGARQRCDGGEQRRQGLLRQRGVRHRGAEPWRLQRIRG